MYYAVRVQIIAVILRESLINDVQATVPHSVELVIGFHLLKHSSLFLRCHDLLLVEDSKWLILLCFRNIGKEKDD